MYFIMRVIIGRDIGVTRKIKSEKALARLKLNNLLKSQIFNNDVSRTIFRFLSKNIYQIQNIYKDIKKFMYKKNHLIFKKFKFQLLFLANKV